MKILFTSDWQCTLQNLNLCQEVVDELLKQSKKHEVDMVVHLGDVKDAFNYFDQRITNFLVSSTHAITSAVGKYYVLLGNHDRIGVDDSLPSCMPVLQSAGAVVVDWPTVEEIKSCSVAWIPYIRDPKRLAEALERVSGDYLFFHAEVKGAQWNQTTQVEEGVSTQLLKRFRGCIGGHIHKPQSMGNVHYVGSPFCCDWGEVNQQKRFLLLDTKTGKLTSIPLSIRNYLDPQVPDFPKRKLTSRDTVRVKVLHGKHSNLPEAVRQARKSAVSKYGPAEIHVVPIRETDEELPMRLDTTGGDEHLLQQYFDAQQVKDPEVFIAYLLYLLSEDATAAARRVEFLRVEASEVLSYKHVAMQYRPGLSLLTGKSVDWENRSNGTGKSNCLALPTIALSGSNPKKQEHDGWRRDDATGPSVVSLDLTVGGKPLKVVRGRHPVKLQAELDGKNVLSGDARQAKKDLEELTGLTQDILMNSLYIDQREVNLLLSGTEKQRKALLSQFLGLERFDKALAAARKNVLQTQHAIEDVDSEISSAKQVLQVHKDSLEQVPKSVGVDTLQKRLAAVEERLRICQAMKRHIEAVEADSWWHAISDLSNALTAERNTINQDITLLQREMDRLDELPETCPTCQQPIRKGALDKHKKELKKQMDDWADACRPLHMVQVRTTRWLNGLETRRLKKDSELLVLEDKTYQLERERAQLSGELQSAAELTALRRQHEHGIRKRTAAIQLFQQYQNDLAELLEFQKEAGAAVSRTGLPAFLVANTCPKLNDAAAFYSKLFTDGEIQVEFAVAEDRTLDVHVVNLHGSRELRGQSEGEMRIASLITSFSVRDVLSQANLLILDEPGDGLDSVNAQAFAAALPEVVERFGCVLVTTHNPHIVSGLEPDYRYLVTKEDGVSVLQELEAGSV